MEASSEETARRLFRAPLVVLSHGPQADPILNYGNRAALALWEMSWEEFIRTPSRLTADPRERGERALLLAEAMQRGWMENYSGVRVSRSGRRFRVEGAVIWNVLDEEDNRTGQAAAFRHWTYL